MSSRKKIALIVGISVCLVSFAVAGILITVGNSTSASRIEDGSPLDDSSAEVATSLPLFHRLNESYVRGSQPAHGGAHVLRRVGIKTIVDLRSNYDHTSELQEAAERRGLAYYWIPMSVWDPPSDVEANQFVSLVTDESKGPFFVFCADGLNRTGMMSAIYRIMHDHWSADQALKEMDQVGFNPYYWSLRQYVWKYARKFRPNAVPKEGRALSSLEEQ